MANPQHFELLMQGTIAWNTWERQQRQEIPDLSGVDLHNADLRNINFDRTDLRNANLSGANLREAGVPDAYIQFIRSLTKRNP